LFADGAFARAAGAPLVDRNRVRLLKDARENYPAWLDAIREARKTVYFESYIIHSDEVGRQFADLLCAKAREGIRVRLIYDWFGARGASSRGFWRRMRQAGVEVRCFNPPRLDSPLGWISRDHRKTITIDGRIGFVSGLCVGQSWVGDPQRGIEPWRDTGVMLEGPAVFDLEQAFAAMWAGLGPGVPAEELVSENAAIPAAGEVAVRVVPTVPGKAGLYRVDQLIAAVARRSIWLTDAYFLGTVSYVEALGAAALDGVDVRLLLPRTSDLPVVRSMSRVGYRALLEAGVRVFEWQGSMLHAKTAVADGRWARVGSTNLNLSSWMGNCEMDVIVEDEIFARRMEEMYLEDLSRSTEIVLGRKHKVHPAHRRSPRTNPKGAARGSAGRAATGVLAIGSTVGAAIAQKQTLGPAETPVLVVAAAGLFLLAAIAALWPHAVSLPAAVLAAWTASTLLLKALRLYRSHRRRRDG
ncbi:MAG TPA: phospholipase D-like domain-containing protein, partial [Acidobacteriaceae bacterium]|nr:phospholipase D-like domain-containing protein [Acidobacteriaceae bacterium]